MEHELGIVAPCVCSLKLADCTITRTSEKICWTLTNQNKEAKDMFISLDTVVISDYLFDFEETVLIFFADTQGKWR